MFVFSTHFFYSNIEDVWMHRNPISFTPIKRMFWSPVPIVRATHLHQNLFTRTKRMLWIHWNPVLTIRSTHLHQVSKVLVTLNFTSQNTYCETSFYLSKELLQYCGLVTPSYPLHLQTWTSTEYSKGELCNWVSPNIDKQKMLLSIILNHTHTHTHTQREEDDPYNFKNSCPTR